jgi:DNA-binding NarL/FixJ family response regulator
MTIRTVLIDDHKILRDGLRALIDHRETVEIVGEATDAATGIAVVQETQPDVVVLDLNLPVTSGIACVGDLLRVAPQVRILILTMHAVPEYVVQAFTSGVHGYAVKGQPADEVLEAIRTIAEGGRYLAPELPRALLEPRRGAGVLSPLQGLSPREREIFDLAVQGFTNEGIGTKLGISVKTVETHRAHVNRKLGVHSAAELIRFAARRGLVI